MTDPDKFLGSPEALEAVAAIAHERWAHWQRYVHGQCIRLDDGSLVIPAQLVNRWTRQISTAYADLTDGEKDSDREQAREYLTALTIAENEAANK